MMPSIFFFFVSYVLCITWGLRRAVFAAVDEGGPANGGHGVHGGLGGEQQAAEPGHRAEHRGEDDGGAQSRTEHAGEPHQD